jgi:hypothetical protein
MDHRSDLQKWWPIHDPCFSYKFILILEIKIRSDLTCSKPTDSMLKFKNLHVNLNLLIYLQNVYLNSVCDERMKIWHSFAIFYNCTYPGLTLIPSTNMLIHTSCTTYDNQFHKKCPEKWFARCLNRTCPEILIIVSVYGESHCVIDCGP